MKPMKAQGSVPKSSGMRPKGTAMSSDDQQDASQFLGRVVGTAAAASK
jgi:hypothetical protein